MALYDYGCVCVWLGELILNTGTSVTMVVEFRFYLK